MDATGQKGTLFERHRADTTNPLIAILCAFALLVTVGGNTGCGDPEGTEEPSLLPIDAQTVLVNETLRLVLTVSNPSGQTLSYSVAGPDLAGLAEVSSLAGTPSGGEYRWTPLASHVGTHEFTFTIASGTTTSSQTVLITVVPAESAAPVFLRPGAGGTYDLARDPCVSFDVEVRDDDTARVEIRPRSTPPSGATLTETGPKASHFEWCPTPEQAGQSDRWTIELEADDFDHGATRHDYLIVLRTVTREDCTGTAPTVNLIRPQSSQRVESNAGYAVAITVFDDTGVGGNPLLYYTTNAPDDPNDPDVTGFEQTEFKQEGAEWQATIPPLGLEPGGERTVYFVVSVTDNDDPSGTSCDHRTETPLLNFVAARPAELVRVGLCEACGDSKGCDTGVCANEGEGNGRCVPACNAETSCDRGACGDVLTVEDATVGACGDVAMVCDDDPNPIVCQDDGSEPNDTADMPAIYTSPFNGVMCAGNEDFFSLEFNANTEVTLTLDGFEAMTANLDLALFASDGRLLGQSAGSGDSEAVVYCVTEADTLRAHVFSPQDEAESAYVLSLSQVATQCCVNDGQEPDNDIEAPRPILDESLNFAGTICPGDTDYLSFTVDGPSRINALIVFTHGEADLDLELYNEGLQYVEGSFSETDEEEIIIEVPDGGVYTLRIYPYGDGFTEYLGQIMLEPLDGCEVTNDCPIGTICRDRLCGPIQCTTPDSCPEGHVCAEGGPVPAAYVCGLSCSINADCRDAGSANRERCKWFPEGRACAREGSRANGEPCGFYTDCGGQRACQAWPGGYCARVGCASNADCETDTFCTAVDGQNVCVLDCLLDDFICRISDGYECDAIDDTSGELNWGCVPASQ